MFVKGYIRRFTDSEQYSKEKYHVSASMIKHKSFLSTGRMFANFFCAERNMNGEYQSIKLA